MKSVLLLAIQLATLSAGAVVAPTSIRGNLIYEDQHYKIETLKGAMPINTSSFNRKSLAFLSTLTREWVFAQGENEDGTLRLNGGLRFEFNTGIQLIVHPQKIEITTPSFIYQRPDGTGRDNEYPFLWFPQREFGLRPVAIEGPLVDQTWLRSFVKRHSGDEAPLFHLTGQFKSPTTFQIDSVQAAGTTLLASGRLIRENGQYQLIFKNGRRILTRPLISADSAVSLERFNGQPVIVEAQIELRGGQEFLVITEGQIQHSNHYTCAVEMFN